MHFHTRNAATHHHTVDPPGHVFRIVPARLFDAFRFSYVLAVGRARIRIAAIGAYHPVDHQFQRAG